ncbi:Solute carrier family 7 [Pristimantis euphronides]
MEAAVLRVRRKRGAEPAGALLISCKRRRVESEAVSTQVFRLAATVTSQNEPVQKYVQDAISRDRATQQRPPIGSLQRIQKDLRARKDAKRQESRYRLVSSLRPKCEEEADSKSESSQPASPAEEQQHEPGNAAASAKDEGSSTGERDETFQVLDMVQEEKEAVDLKPPEPDTVLCNSVRMIRERLTVSQEEQGSEHRENPEEFVYDIYYAETSPHNWIQDLLSVQPYRCEQELMADGDGDEPDEVYEDEDDENEESNWRNDYPDEEDEESGDREERYMGYYEDSDEDTRGRAWEVYCEKAMKEREEEEDSD